MAETPDWRPSWSSEHALLNEAKAAFKNPGDAAKSSSTVAQNQLGTFDTNTLQEARKRGSAEASSPVQEAFCGSDGLFW